MSVSTKQRLASLDALRGFDLFVLVALGPLVMTVSDAVAWDGLSPLRKAFTHVAWEGFAFWDLVMPLFVFMAGASIPFALSNYVGGAKRGMFLLRLLKRVALLWLLGMVVQGNLLGLDPSRLYLYTNTLQAIASGYLIAALTFTTFRWKGQLLVCVALLLAYWGLMEWVRVDGFGGGSYEQTTNLAEWVDRTVLGRFRDAAQVGGDGRVVFAPWYHYTWILSTLNFGATALTGVFAGLIARNAWGGMLKVLAYAGFGVAMLALGLVWGEAMPIIKTIWTSSMVLFSSGLCFLLMGLFFFIYDVCHLSLGLNFLKVYGMNSIVAYVISEVVNFRCMAHSVFWGLEQYLGAYYPCLLTFCQILIVFTILRLMYKNEVFVKV